MLLLVIVTSAEGLSTRPLTEKTVPLFIVNPLLPTLRREGCGAAHAPVASNSTVIIV
jgi:hypothetical protein